MREQQAKSSGRITRRRFLRHTAAAAAGLAWGIPRFVRGSALGYGRPAPSERITLGFIGLGWKGLEGCCGSLVRHFMENPVSEALVMCDVNRRSAEAAQTLVTSRYGATSCGTTLDFREVVARPDVDRRSHRHARPLARHPDHLGVPPAQGRLLREAAFAGGKRSLPPLWQTG